MNNFWLPTSLTRVGMLSLTTAFFSCAKLVSQATLPGTSVNMKVLVITAETNDYTLAPITKALEFQGTPIGVLGLSAHPAPEQINSTFRELSLRYAPPCGSQDLVGVPRALRTTRKLTSVVSSLQKTQRLSQRPQFAGRAPYPVVCFPNTFAICCSRFSAVKGFWTKPAGPLPVKRWMAACSL